MGKLDAVLDAARNRIERLSPEEAAASDCVIVDLRCGEDREREGVVPSSVWVPRSVLEWRADPEGDHRDDRIADPSKLIVLMCNDGYSSSLAAASLKDLGFGRVADVVGGYRAWKRAGLPVEDP